MDGLDTVPYWIYSKGMEGHEHKWKNGFCECGAESKNGYKRRLARERRKIAVEYKKFDLYDALRAKDGMGSD